MGLSLFFIIIGIIILIIPKYKWYHNSFKKHSSELFEEILSVFRYILGVFFILIGVSIFLFSF